MNMERLRNWLGQLPTHVIVIGFMLIWLVPTLGLLVTSFRPVQDANVSGWWTVLGSVPGEEVYVANCASCHGANGDAIAAADLGDPDFISAYRRSIQISATFDNVYAGQIHIPETQRPSDQELADILSFLRRKSGVETRPTLTINNYIDALVGYRGTTDY